MERRHTLEFTEWIYLFIKETRALYGLPYVVGACALVRREYSERGLTFMSRSGEEEPLPLIAAAAGACHTLTHSRGAGGAGGRRTASDRDCRSLPRRTARAPTATGCLISHYNLRARFLPLLLPRFVLRIIECIPLAPPPGRHARRAPPR